MSQAFQLLKDILSSDFGSFAFVFGVICLVIWLTHWVTKKITEITASHGQMQKENRSVSDNVDRVCGKIECNIDDIRKDIAYLKGMVDIFKSGQAPFAQSHSPVSLTELGSRVARELDAEGMIRRNWDCIVKDIEEHAGGMTAYDIQEYCMETAVVEPERFLLPDDMSSLKSYAFRNGRQIAVYAQIFAILIRDKYLQVKGIPIDEVDKTQPD